MALYYYIIILIFASGYVFVSLLSSVNKLECINVHVFVFNILDKKTETYPCCNGFSVFFM